MTERKARSFATRAAALISSLQKTGAVSEAHRLLADSTTEVFDLGVRGHGLQSALVPLVRSELGLSDQGGEHSSDSVLRMMSAELGGGAQSRDRRPADISFIEACTTALSALLHDGSDSMRHAAARQAQTPDPYSTLLLLQTYARPCLTLLSLGESCSIVDHPILDVCCRELLTTVAALKERQPGPSAAPLRHARLLMLEAQALATAPQTAPQADCGELRAAVDAALELFEAASVRQVTAGS